jgi:hypothetical protein
MARRSHPKKSKKKRAPSSQSKNTSSGANLAYYFLAVIGLVLLALGIASVLGYFGIL